jgi:hypothetical protein
MVLSNDIKEKAEEVVEDVKEVVEDVKDAVEDVKDVVEDVKDAVEDVKDAVEDVKDGFGEVFEDIQDNLSLSVLCEILRSSEREKEDDKLKQYYLKIEKIKECVWGNGGYNCIYYNMENKTLDIAIKEISIKVFESIKQNGDEYNNLATIAKKMVFDLNNYISIGNTEKELYNKTEYDKFGKSKYIIMKMKRKETLNKCILLCKNNNKIIQLKYCIIVPLNDKAILECNKFMKPQIKNIIKKLKKNAK